MPSGSSFRALYIEDDPLVADIVREALMPLCRVSVEPDGVIALEQVLRDPPDLLLVDLQLPTIGGFEIIRRLRKNPDLVTIPVVVISARTLGEEAQSSKELGCAGFVEKPFGLATLRQVVEDALGASALQSPSMREG